MTPDQLKSKTKDKPNPMQGKTRNARLAGYEHTKAVVNGKAEIHPLPEHITSKRYYDKEKEKEVEAAKKVVAQPHWQRRLMPATADKPARKLWWPANQAAIDVLAAMTDEEREAFQTADQPMKHPQECESKAILNGSKIKGLKTATKEAEAFPVEHTKSEAPVVHDEWHMWHQQKGLNQAPTHKGLTDDFLRRLTEEGSK